ncbi:MAG: iron-sulfur cluster assembly protein [Desulfurococcales archaeon]|nr:iron-sulfur cluster assembly protein [Desulfurococcales archaeon]
MGIFSRFLKPSSQERPRVAQSPFMKKRIDEALAALSKVVVPGYDVDIVSSGVVTRIRVSTDGSRIIVFLDYTGSNPGCSFCRFLNDRIWGKIIGDAKRHLEEAGFKESFFLDAVTGAPIVTT